MNGRKGMRGHLALRQEGTRIRGMMKRAALLHHRFFRSDGYTKKPCLSFCQVEKKGLLCYTTFYEKSHCYHHRGGQRCWASDGTLFCAGRRESCSLQPHQSRPGERRERDCGTGWKYSDCGRGRLAGRGCLLGLSARHWNL